MHYKLFVQVVEDSENEVTEKDANSAQQMDPAQIKQIIDTSSDINVIMGAVQNCRKVRKLSIQYTITIGNHHHSAPTP